MPLYSIRTVGFHTISYEKAIFKSDNIDDITIKLMFLV